MAKTISFTNQKGGVGKTTCCVNLGAYVAAVGKKVLIVDIDPQGNATSGLGLNNPGQKGAYELLARDADIKSDELILATAVENLFLLPSSINLAAAEIELAGVFGREGVLKQKLAPIAEEYDYIFIDCPPSLGTLTVNALTMSDSILIPMQCEYYALEGLSQLIFTINNLKKILNPRLDIEGIVLMMYDKRSNLTAQVQSEIKKFFGDKLYETTIPRNIRLAEAPSYGRPIAIYDKQCKGAKSFKALCDEFLSKQKRG